MEKFNSSSKFSVYSSFTLSNDDVNIIFLLYAPLIGSDAVTLYCSFQSLLERNNLKSEKLTHQDLFDLYSLKAESFLKARYKLEGIGLLITYLNEEKECIYILCPPLTAKNFIKDATLGLFLYSKVSKETFDFITNHFKIEKIEKNNYSNVTKTFDEVFTLRQVNQETFEKFSYLLGRKPNKSIKILNNPFNYEKFLSMIEVGFLEYGITTKFKDQICNLAFVYGFDESDMVGLYHDSINKSQLFDYRLLKKKANILFNYKKNMRGPVLEEKNDYDEANNDLLEYLNQASPSQLLEDVLPGYPTRYLDTILKIYDEIDLPKGVLNCMIIKVLKDKSGDLPTINYFKKVAESWVSDNIFTTKDAMRYVTTMKSNDEIVNDVKTIDDNGGLTEI